MLKNHKESSFQCFSALRETFSKTSNDFKVTPFHFLNVMRQKKMKSSKGSHFSMPRVRASRPRRANSVQLLGVLGTVNKPGPAQVGAISKAQK